jgi:RsiW-degrading membrane proteinase PrsW (M82 family)
VAHPSWQIAASGAVPALVAMWVVDRLDAKRPEPPSLRRLVVLGGMLSVIPAILLEMSIGNWLGEPAGKPVLTYWGASTSAFVVAAMIEEACKISVIYWVVWKRPEFDERMDGIVYGSRAGLGFALVENVLYLLNADDMSGLMRMWILRAVLAVPGHAMWSGMIGAMAARKRFDGRGLGLLGGYLLAVAFHGAYDLTAFLHIPLHYEGHELLVDLTFPFLFVLTALAFFTLRSMAKTALALDDADAARAYAAAELPRAGVVTP